MATEKEMGEVEEGSLRYEKTNLGSASGRNQSLVVFGE
jgi:hypothetical protein